MDRTLYDTIFAIATETRAWVQAKADKSDYHADDLNCWCAIASGELHKRLVKAGIDSKIHMWNDWGCHCYCVVEDHVVDVTATQFKPYRDVPVLILHCKEAYHEFHQGSLVFDSARALRTHQKNTRWPSQQIAYA